MSGKRILHQPAPAGSTPPKENPLLHVVRATGYSLEGIGAALRHELAFRIEAVAFVVLMPVVIAAPFELLLKAMLTGSMLLVLIVELLNSSLERAIDYISPQRHPLAKRVKDMASAAVLLSLLNAGTFWLVALLSWVQA